MIDLGVQVAPEKFIDAIREHQPDIVGFSAFLTTTMPMFKANINALQKAGMRDQVIVMVGGAPVTQEYADVVGRRRLRLGRLGRRGQGQGTAAPSPCDGARLEGARMETVLRSASRELRIGGENPFCIVGERINPTGRKIFQEQLRSNDLSRIEIDVAQQVAGGAMMLDVNMGAPLADETELMVAAVKLIQSVCDLPLCLDSSIIEVLEAGLTAYQGKALVNSVTAEDERLDAILPLVREHGAAVIALPNDEEEIPEEPAAQAGTRAQDRGRGHRQVRHPARGHHDRPAGHAGRRGHLAGAAHAGDDRLVCDEFGVNMTLGASNVSFGMPERARDRRRVPADGHPRPG